MCLIFEAWSEVCGDILGRIRRYGHVGGGMSLGVGFEVSKGSVSLFLPATCG